MTTENNTQAALYVPQLSPEWKAWVQGAGKLLSQVDFADFLDEHACYLLYLAANGDESARRWPEQNPTPVPSPSANTELTTTPTETKTEKQG